MKRLIADMRKKRDLKRALNAGRTLMLKEQRQRPGIRPAKKPKLNRRKIIKIAVAALALLVLGLSAVMFFGLVDLSDALSSDIPAVQPIPQRGETPTQSGAYVNICEAMGLTNCDTAP